MQSPVVPTAGTGALAQALSATMAKPLLSLGSLRWSLWSSSGQRGSACAASTWRTCGGGRVAG
eukprot:3352429-Alexandrium_andersonii.AAC.1